MNYKEEARKLAARVECLTKEAWEIMRSVLISSKSSVDMRERFHSINRERMAIDPEKVIFIGLSIPFRFTLLSKKDYKDKMNKRRKMLIRKVARLLRENKLKPLP